MSEKIEFPSVKVISPIFGVDEGVVLEYNDIYKKYVSMNENEDIGPGEGEYYYSGSSIAIDRRLVEDNLGKIFEPTESISAKEKAKKVLEGTEMKIQVWDQADLYIVCGRCNHEQFVTTGTGGIQIYMPTNSGAETRLVCENCNNIMSLKYRNGKNFSDEEYEKVYGKSRVVEPIDEPQVLVKEESDEPQEKSE